MRGSEGVPCIGAAVRTGKEPEQFVRRMPVAAQNPVFDIVRGEDQSVDVIGEVAENAGTSRTLS